MTLIYELERGLSDKTVDVVMGLFAPGSVMMTLAAPLRVVGDDPAAGRKRLQSWFDSWDGRLKIEHKDIVIEVEDDLALASMIGHMVGAKKEGGKTDLWYRETLGLRRIDGAWKIVHEHQSVPLKMDGSGKAELDLKS